MVFSFLSSLRCKNICFNISIYYKLRRSVHKFHNLAATWRETLDETWALVKLNNKWLESSPAFRAMSGPCQGQGKISARGVLEYRQAGLFWDTILQFFYNFTALVRKNLLSARKTTPNRLNFVIQRTKNIVRITCRTYNNTWASRDSHLVLKYAFLQFIRNKRFCPPYTES